MNGKDDMNGTFKFTINDARRMLRKCLAKFQ